MEQLAEFFGSENGKIACYVLLFVGVTDFLIARLVFGKMRKNIENKMLQEFSLSQRELMQVSINKIQSLMKILKISGLVFVTFAIFGLMM